ncbi:hypothetical protein [Pseudoroseicyclus tamaricis]|uniref:DUF4238 domain-containing protein n=1 Tax=Pseudoroseicyclus tamaricis TaxID=2705421 RepID=A0A6B2JUS4_9RHOB|nr:hypothetical protein [Pseudoroseicyclus tamaricis]NDU99933.1 hypothetical protein [Pseudoroseicyclus tamaricis]
MASGRSSRNHHWWPVGLQSYWTDRFGYVSWIGPGGCIEKKRSVNRKIGFKIHGHTIFRGTDWESNFEYEFDIDNEVHKIISALQGMTPLGRTPKEFFALIKMLGKKDRSLHDMCKFYHLEEQLHRGLLLFLYSLLIRSPGSRSRYEGYPEMIGLPPDEEVGKGNMVQNYRIAKKLCMSGLISNQYFVLMHSPLKKFIFGDGSLDWLTGNLVANRINGRALLPLTPHLCVYFCTPMAMRSTPNCASISVPPWMVEWVNGITQIYSKEKLFFLGKPPQISDAFRRNQFLEHAEQKDALIDMLDEAIGNKRSRNHFFGLNANLY